MRRQYDGMEGGSTLELMRRLELSEESPRKKEEINQLASTLLNHVGHCT